MNTDKTCGNPDNQHLYTNFLEILQVIFIGRYDDTAEMMQRINELRLACIVEKRKTMRCLDEVVFVIECRDQLQFYFAGNDSIVEGKFQLITDDQETPKVLLTVSAEEVPWLVHVDYFLANTLEKRFEIPRTDYSDRLTVSGKPGISCIGVSFITPLELDRLCTFNGIEFVTPLVYDKGVELLTKKKGIRKLLKWVEKHPVNNSPIATTELGVISNLKQSSESQVEKLNSEECVVFPRNFDDEYLFGWLTGSMVSITKTKIEHDHLYSAIPCPCTSNILSIQRIPTKWMLKCVEKVFTNSNAATCSVRYTDSGLFVLLYTFSDKELNQALREWSLQKFDHSEEGI